MFCRQCGTQLPDDSKFCIVCGTQVVAPSPAASEAGAPAKQYVAVFEGVRSGEIYDLFVTSTRFVLIRTGSGGGLGAVLGPVGSVLDAGISAATRKRYDKETTLEEMLQKDKKNYVLNYTGIHKITLTNSTTGGRTMEVQYLGKGGKEKKAKYGVSKQQILDLENLLPTIPSLAQKLSS